MKEKVVGMFDDILLLALCDPFRVLLLIHVHILCSFENFSGCLL